MKTETELDLIVIMLSKSKILRFILLRKFYINVFKDQFTEIANYQKKLQKTKSLYECFS